MNPALSNDLYKMRLELWERLSGMIDRLRTLHVRLATIPDDAPDKAIAHIALVGMHGRIDAILAEAERAVDAAAKSKEEKAHD